MAAHITKTSILTGQTMYFAGGARWTDVFEDRKIYSSVTKANNEIKPKPRTIAGQEIYNANGAFKNATVVNE